jgi:TatD DNase family protein
VDSHAHLTALGGGPDPALVRARAAGVRAVVCVGTDAGSSRAAAALTPLDRMLIETDAPFLAPVPHRGVENEPAYLPVVGAALAVASGHGAGTLAAATAAAAAAVFGPAAGG